MAVSPEPGGSLPIYSGLVQLESPPREIAVGLDSAMPAVLAADGLKAAIEDYRTRQDGE